MCRLHFQQLQIRSKSKKVYTAVSVQRKEGGAKNGKLEAASLSTVHEVVNNLTRRLFIIDKNSTHNFLIDTGADISILPAAPIHKHKPPDTRVLYAANGSTIRTYGKKILAINFGLRRQFDWQFVIADVTRPIIGADFLSHYGLLVDLKNKRLIDEVTKLDIAGKMIETDYERVSTICSNTNLVSIQFVPK